MNTITAVGATLLMGAGLLLLVPGICCVLSFIEGLWYGDAEDDE